MDKISHAVAASLQENGYISKGDYEICKYGISMFLTSVLEILFIVIVSIPLKNLSETLIWMIAFIPIRMFGGGYHADTRLKCFLILIGVYIAFSIVIMYMPLCPAYMVSASILTIIGVKIWAPLHHRNKDISESEDKAYKKIAIAASIIESAFVLFMIILNRYSVYIQAFSFGIFTAGASLLAGRIKYYLEVKNNGTF